MNPLVITDKIGKVAKTYSTMSGWGKDYQLNCSIQVFYTEFHEVVCIDMGSLTSETREFQRALCQKRLKCMLNQKQSELTQTSKVFDEEDLNQVGAMRWKEGIVVMAGIGSVACKEILAVALYRLKVIDEKDYKKIKEELQVEPIGEPINEKFKNLELCIPN